MFDFDPRDDDPRDRDDEWRDPITHSHDFDHMRLNFGMVPSFEKITALTFSAPGRSKNPEGISLLPCLCAAILTVSTRTGSPGRETTR